MLSAKVQEGMKIRMMEDLMTHITITDSMEIPLSLNVEVPLNTEIFMKDTLHVKFDLPVDIVLNDQELQLRNLEIPFNERLYIDDELELNIVIPLDTKISTNFKGFPNVSVPVKGEIPVSTKVPIKQHLQVRDTLILNPANYTIPMKTIIPVDAHIPLNQGVAVEGTIIVPLKETIKVPVLNQFQAKVKVVNALPVSFETPLEAQAQIKDTLRVTMPPLKIDPSKIRISTED